ncbi:MAG TPA: hypothetical protein VLK33_08040 [Terriglobales bacterium]|nr:hypothetical protein [Terriglobales bacterium]
MKKIVTNVVLMMAFVFVLTAAGYSQQPLLKANVPFDFTVGKKTFPAGEYTVVRLSAEILSLRSDSNSAVTTFVTSPTAELVSQNNPKLKFKTVGGEYILTEIWPDGGSNGYELLVTKPLNVIAEAPSTKGQIAASTYVGK